MLKKCGISALVLGLVLSVASYSKADDKDKKFDNPTAGKCPVSGKDADPAHSLTIKDKTYDFCCDKCKAKFEKDPSKFLDKK